MRRIITNITCLLCVSMLAAQSMPSLQVKEVKLSNGLTVWLNEDHTQPKIFGAIVVKAGSKDSPDTGIAHYFEHIMFKGTDKIGTTDYAAEKIYLDSIASKYDKLAQTQQPEQRKEIQQQINLLSIKAAKYVIPNEFSRLISRYGGTELNAYTSYDYTVYHNTFSPQFFRQWAELNSERLIRPVFRLFQSELETVYEEKNMYADALAMMALEKWTERFFAPHPYCYPIIGSTESLKNPRLSEMEKFFKQYYVASNMGLILSGDFNTEEIIPILEQTFSRIHRGEVPVRQTPAPAPFKGREEISIKLPIPLIKLMAMGFRGIPVNHPDEPALNIALKILNNDNGTGYLDLLSVNNKLLGAQAFSQSLNDAGMIAVMILPKLMFQSKSKAEKLVWNEIERVKKGDFNDELFRNLKLELQLSYKKMLENIDSRSSIMPGLFSQGTSWEDFMTEHQRIELLTKEDVKKVAQKYFGNNYLYASKTKGNYRKDNLQKPGFAPIIPGQTDTTSEYGKKLEQIPTAEKSLRFVDFNKDIQTLALSEKVTLYLTPNPVNDLFSFNICHNTGTYKKPATSLLSSYLHLLGTDSLTFETLRNKLQAMGSALEFDNDANSFTIGISGFDRHFDETLSLVADFLNHVKADDSKLKQVKDAERMSDKAFFKSADQIADAAIEKVMFGAQSSYLTKLSYQQVQAMKGQELVDLLGDIRQTECSMHYSGTLSPEKVSESIQRLLDTDKVTQPSSVIIFRDKQLYDKSAVYFFDQPKTSQSIVYGYIPNQTATDNESQAASKLFGSYFGGDMSSLMFQELREFRSYAYRAYGYYSLPSPGHDSKNGALITMLSTQGDKTTDAMAVLDSMLHFMPEKPQKVIEAKQKTIGETNNSFPSFRERSAQIENWKQKGYTEDPNRILIKYQKNMDMKTVLEFYEKNIKNQPVIYIVIGDSKKIDMNKLAAFGEIIPLSKDDIYK